MQHTMRSSVSMCLASCGRQGARAAAVALAVALAGGCGGDDDKNLFGDDMSPTQLQQAEEGSGPQTMPDPSDGVNEDPFTDNPDFPYQDAP